MERCGHSGTHSWAPTESRDCSPARAHATLRIGIFWLQQLSTGERKAPPQHSETPSGLFRVQLLDRKENGSRHTRKEELRSSECKIMKRAVVNLLSQGLHGCVFNMLSLFTDPVRFIRDHHRQNHLDHDEQMLQTHTHTHTAVSVSGQHTRM